MKFFYLIAMLGVLPIAFFLPGYLASYQKGETQGSDAHAFIDSINPFAELSPASGSVSGPVESNKHIISTHRFQRQHFKSSDSRLSHGYFLNAPAKPWVEGLKFPLIIHLNDKDTPSYSSEYISQDQMMLNFPAFNVVPIIDLFYEKKTFDVNQVYTNSLMSANNSNNSSGHHTGKKKSQANFNKTRLYHDNAVEKTQSVVPSIIEMTRSIIEQYPVDEKRVYIVGCGYGAMTLFGAIKSAPDLYSAGLVVSGAWSARDAKSFTSTPLLIMNGSRNLHYSPFSSKSLAKAIRQHKGKVAYKEFESMRHDCSYVKFYNSTVWKWIFAHR